MSSIRNTMRAMYWKMPEPVTNYIQKIRDERLSSNKIYRPYFNATKSIFIHIPKAAGKSISYALYGEDPKHHKLYAFESLDRYKYSQYFKFVFVRNPWSRLYSIYNYLINQNNNHPYGKFYWINNFNSFEEFVLTGLTDELIKKHLFLNTQHSFLIDSSGKTGVDFIGRMETINKDFEYVASKLGSINRLDTIGASTIKIDYTSIYTHKMIEKVRELYRCDVDMLGYDFYNTK